MPVLEEDMVVGRLFFFMLVLGGGAVEHCEWFRCDECLP